MAFNPFPTSNNFVIVVESRKFGEMARFTTGELNAFHEAWTGFCERMKSSPGYREWDGLIETQNIIIRAEDTYCPKAA